MIIATIAAIMIIFGGSGFSLDVFNKAAGDVIEDKDRVKQIKAITKQANKEVRSITKRFNNASKEAVEMMTRSDVTREEIFAYFNQIEKEHEAFQEALIKLRFQARDLMSQEEWEAMYARIE